MRSHRDSAVPRVLHIPFSIETGGAERVLAELLLRARTRGEPQRLAALRGTRLEQAMSDALGEPITGPVAAQPAKLGRRDGLRLSSYVRRTREPGEIVHAHLPWPDRLGMALLARGRSPVVVTFQLLPDHEILGLGDVVFQPLVNLKRAAQISQRLGPMIFTAVSETDARRLREVFPGVRVERVYNCAAAPRGDEPPPLPFGEGVRLFSVGSLTERKGFDRLLRALASEELRSRPFSLCIAGEGERREQLIALAAELGLANKVHFVGQVNAPRLYRQADLFLSGSHAEGLPLVLLEAMTAGIAVAVSDIPAHREAVGDFAEALLDANEARWPAQLARLFDDAGLRARLAAQAKARADSTFSAQAQDAAFGALYQELQDQAAP